MQNHHPSYPEILQAKTYSHHLKQSQVCGIFIVLFLQFCKCSKHIKNCQKTAYEFNSFLPLTLYTLPRCEKLFAAITLNSRLYVLAIPYSSSSASSATATAGGRGSRQSESGGGPPLAKLYEIYRITYHTGDGGGKTGRRRQGIPRKVASRQIIF